MTTVDRAAWKTIYAALAHEESRELLQYLKGVQVAQIEDVAQQLLKRGYGSTEERSDTMRVRLHHVRLPELAEAELLTWDSEQNQVTLTAVGSQLPAELLAPNLVSSPDVSNKEPVVD
ncbi:hypothetical protein ACFQH2_08340 [Natronoarchaeum sp. GCM10025703]|uniref:DUF7344 domain-containing protein n=1 Tax=unclassified Natronoarchaeum TaxID=2620183 RepID=UPI0036062A16